MKKEDIKELTTDELRIKIEEEKLLYRKLKFNHAVSPLEDPMRLKHLRKDIARFGTELRQREMGKVAARSQEAMKAEKATTKGASKKKESSAKKTTKE